jgi:hypothetical protein
VENTSDAVGRPLLLTNHVGPGATTRGVPVYHGAYDLTPALSGIILNRLLYRYIFSFFQLEAREANDKLWLDSRFHNPRPYREAVDRSPYPKAMSKPFSLQGLMETGAKKPRGQCSRP